jgi:branched-subunit amino acid aminotransferase/4-amino-4-deoxychorismate lyase
MHYLTLNGKLVDGYDKDSIVFLVDGPRGVYTTVRTFEKRSIFQFHLHCKRIAYGCGVMIQDQNTTIPRGLTIITEQDSLTKLVTEELKIGMALSKEDGDKKITILVNWDIQRETYQIWIHYSVLPELALPPVSVEVMPGTRTHIKAKDSEWARYRRRIEEMKFNKKSTDCVLLDKDGKLNECTAANFFAIKDGKVYTGLKGVLYGTVMDTVLKVCAEMGIEVVTESPSIDDLTKFQEVFLSSTTRLVVSIDKLIVHNADCFFDGHTNVVLEKVHDNIKEYEFKTDVSKKINENVKKKLAGLSVLILDK